MTYTSACRMSPPSLVLSLTSPFRRLGIATHLPCLVGSTIDRYDANRPSPSFTISTEAERYRHASHDLTNTLICLKTSDQLISIPFYDPGRCMSTKILQSGETPLEDHGSSPRARSEWLTGTAPVSPPIHRVWLDYYRLAKELHRFSFHIGSSRFMGSMGISMSLRTGSTTHQPHKNNTQLYRLN